IDNLNNQISSLKSENGELRKKSIDNYKKETVVELVNIRVSSRPLNGWYTMLERPDLIDKSSNIWGGLSNEPVSLVEVLVKEFQAIKLSEEKHNRTMNEY